MLQTNQQLHFGQKLMELPNIYPRDSYQVINKLINDIDFYKEFKNNPLHVLKKCGFDTRNMKLPDNFIMPTQEVLKNRLIYIYENEDFVSPAEMSTLPVLPVVFVFIPVFAY